MMLSDDCMDFRRKIDAYLWNQRLSPEETTMIYILEDILSRLQKRAVNREHLMKQFDDFYEKEGAGDS